MKTPTTKRRLRTLIAFMRSLPRSANKKFDMSYWFEHEGNHRHEVGRYITPEAMRHCGTKACALGWAATVPSLAKAGLKVEAKSHSELPVRRAEKVFGLSTDQFEALFTVENPRMQVATTPRQWAQEAERLMRRWSAA